MKKIFFILTISAITFFNSCDENPSPGGPLINYDLVIDNQTATDYLVYLKALVEDGSGFTMIGEVEANRQFRREQLVIDISYECRLVEAGGSVDDPALSKSFTHSQLTDYIWTLK